MPMKGEYVMKMVFLVFITTVMCLGLSVTNSGAQSEETPPSLYAIWDIVVHPSKATEYEALAKKLADLYRKQDVPYKWGTASSDDYQYNSWAPVKDLADVSAMFKAYNDAMEKMGPVAKETDEAIGATVESVRLSLWRRNQELSYEPEQPRLEQEEVKFFRYFFLYGKLEKLEQLRGVFNKYEELYKRKNIQTPYSIWVGELGVESPVHCVVIGAKSSVDYFNQAAEISKALGDEGDALWKELLSCVRKVEPKSYWLRPELGTETPAVAATDANP